MTVAVNRGRGGARYLATEALQVESSSTSTNLAQTEEGSVDYELGGLRRGGDGLGWLLRDVDEAEASSRENGDRRGTPRLPRRPAGRNHARLRPRAVLASLPQGHRRTRSRA